MAVILRQLSTDVQRFLAESGAVIVLLLTAFCASADDWPQWRGLDRDGVWKETRILQTFPAGADIGIATKEVHTPGAEA